MASIIIHRAGGSGVGSADCTATKDKLLAGAGTAITVDSGDVPTEGTMPNQGAVTPTALNAGGSYTIPAGYHNGSGVVSAKDLASQTSATAEAGHIFADKTAWVNGSKITGTMPNHGAVTPAGLNCGGSYTIPTGYHNGSGVVTANSLASQTSATATAATIRSGYTAWVDGVKITGTLVDYDGSVS